MSKIIRRPDFSGGGVTEQEQEKFAEYVKLWTARAFRTEPIEPEKIADAILGLYRVSSLKDPRVVVVPSPLVMAVAGGFASAIWWLRKHNATYNATDDATSIATYNATRNATRDATSIATYNATRNATRDATSIATYNATDDATSIATYNATDDATSIATYNATRNATSIATYNATRDATLAATRNATSIATYNATANNQNWIRRLAEEISSEHADFLVNCAASSLNMYQGGNMWSAYDCYLTACRDILGLRLPEHEKYQYWEQAAIHGGFRILHDEFCMVCDFPEFIKIDENNLPHCETGPSHRWRDRWELFHWHGVAVNRKIITEPEKLTVAEIDAEDNSEVKRVMIERLGWDIYLAGLIPTDRRYNERDGQWEHLYEMEDHCRFLVSDPSTGRKYSLAVPSEITNCENAQNWLSHGLDRFSIHRS